jgi:hypothetical protein
VLSPLERLALNGKLDRFRCETLHRLWEHWRQGQLDGNLRSPDLDKVVVDGPAFGPAGTHVRFHRRSFEVGWGRLDQPERDVVGMVVLQEQPVKAAGIALGFKSPCRGRERVLALLRTAADRLCGR